MIDYSRDSSSNSRNFRTRNGTFTNGKSFSPVYKLAVYICDCMAGISYVALVLLHDIGAGI